MALSQLAPAYVRNHDQQQPKGRPMAAETGFSKADLLRILTNADEDDVAAAIIALEVTEVGQLGDLLTTMAGLTIKINEQGDENAAQIEVLKALAFGKFIRSMLGIISFVIRLTPIGKFAAVALVAFAAIDHFIESEELPDADTIRGVIDDLGLTAVFEDTLAKITEVFDEGQGVLEEHYSRMADVMFAINTDASTLISNIDQIKDQVIPGMQLKIEKANLGNVIADGLNRDIGELLALVESEARDNLDNLLSNMLLVIESAIKQPEIVVSKLKREAADFLR